MRIPIPCCAAIVSLGLATTAIAQPTPNPIKNSHPSSNSTPAGKRLDEFLRKERNEEARKRVRDRRDDLSAEEKTYQNFVYAQTQKLYEWQLFATKWIFWVVLAIVGLGLVFSGVQFYIDFRRVLGTPRPKAPPPAPAIPDWRALGTPRPKAPPPARAISEMDAKPPAPVDPPDHTIEASLQGIKVTSSVLGVVILVVSLAFFYLFLRYVYPITRADLPDTDPPSASAGK